MFYLKLFRGLHQSIITHTAGKNLEVVEPKLQISADDFNT